MKRAITNEEQHRRMTQGSVSKAVISLAVPTTISQLITVVYNTADTYFVAQTGTSQAAAVGVVFSLMSLIQAIGFGLGMGSSSIISRKLGKNEIEASDRTASSAVAAAVILGVILEISGLIFLNSLMKLLGATQTVLPYAEAYGSIILYVTPFMCTAFVLNAVLRSEGEASLAMWGLCTGGILNIILDPVFIFVFNMGIAGAALATAISQMVSFAILLSFFLRKRSIVSLKIKSISLDINTYKEIVATGMPTICRQGLGSVSSALLNVQASAFGDAALASITIANKIYMLVRNAVLGIGQGYQPVAGYNYGAGKKERVREAFKFTCIAGTSICIVSSVIIYIYAPSIIIWFRKEDAEVIELGTQALKIACAAIPFMAYSTYVNQLYQCLGFVKPATFLACCRQGIFFIPLIVILPAMFKFRGVQMGQPGADICTFIVSVFFQIRFFKKYLKSNN